MLRIFFLQRKQLHQGKIHEWSLREKGPGTQIKKVKRKKTKAKGSKGFGLRKIEKEKKRGNRKSKERSKGQCFQSLSSTRSNPSKANEKIQGR